MGCAVTKRHLVSQSPSVLKEAENENGEKARGPRVQSAVSFFRYFGFAHMAPMLSVPCSDACLFMLFDSYLWLFFHIRFRAGKEQSVPRKVNCSDLTDVQTPANALANWDLAEHHSLRPCPGKRSVSI